MARAVEADLHTVHGVITVRRNAKAAVIEPANRQAYSQLSRALEIQRRRRRIGMYPKRKGGARIILDENQPTVEQMRKTMGLDEVEPVHVSPGSQSSLGDEDEMLKWYEEELRAAYDEYGRE